MSWARELGKGERPICLLLLAFVGVAALYGVVTPVFEAPDEIQHFYYVKHLVDERRLPVQGGEGEARWAQEGNQPPLYYLLAALITWPVDTRDAEEVIWENPQANVGDPLRPGNKNYIVHQESEGFPYTGTVLAVHCIRLLSAALAAGTVFVTYRITRELMPQRRGLALAAAGLVAFNPQFCFIAGAISNDNLVTFLAALNLWFAVRYLLERTTRREVAVWGVCLGLAALAKVSGLALLPLVAITLLARAFHLRSWRRFLQDGLLLLGLWTALAGWWYARNWVLYGEPTGTSAMIAIAGARRTPLTWGDITRELQGLRTSYWGVLGWFNILAWPWLYRVFDVLGVVCLLGLAWATVRSRRACWQPRCLAVALLAIWCLVFLASLLLWTSITPGSQGRLLFPAAPAVATLGLLGWSRLPLLGRQRWPLGVLVGGLGVLAVATPFVYIQPAYARPPILTEAEIPAAARVDPLDHGGLVRLLGCEIQPRAVYPGERVEVTLYWQGLKPIDYDFNLFIRLLGYREQVVGQVDSYPGAGTFPTSLWQTGQVIRDRYWVQVSPFARTPVVAKVDIGFYDRWSMAGLPSHAPDGSPRSGIIGTVKVLPREGAIQAPAEPSYFLGEGIGLMEYEVSQTTVRPGDALTVSVIWKSLREVPEDYTVFLHLENRGRVLAQTDRPPLLGYYPTSAWNPGELIPDRIRMVVPAKTPSGTYPLILGLYRLQDLSRLPVTDAQGNPLDDHLLLAQVTVADGR
ncbi:MAG: DUF2142 domain-containing protein [Anaerolineae bacterium]